MLGNCSAFHQLLLCKGGDEPVPHTDKRTVKRINELLRDAMRNPFEGMGKPEPLRFDLAGCWSRRINQEDRLVYKVDERSEALIVLQCRYHY